MYSENDFRLYHSWGKKPEQKAREREYNAEYYRTHKEKWKKDHKVLDKLGVDERYEKTLADKKARQTKWYLDTTDEISDKHMDNAKNEASRLAYYNFDKDSKAPDEIMDKVRTERNASNANRSVEYNRATSDASAAASAAANATRKYEQTPIGKVEKAYNRGKKAFNDALKKFKG